MTKETIVKPEDFTLDELQDKVSELSDANLVRLKKIASNYVGNHELTEEDLIQESILRILSGARKKCAKNLDFMTFLAGIIKSVAHEKRTEAKKLAYYDDQTWSDISDGRASIEDVFSNEEASKILWQKIEAIFQGDDEGLLIFYYMQDGFSAKGIRNEENMGKKHYDTVLRRIRRKINIHMKRGHYE